MNQRMKRELREWTESIVIALILALVIRSFVVQAFKIPSGSMIPTLLIGDRIFVNKFIYGTKIPFTDKKVLAMRDPASGDIVVFKSPQEPKKDFVKRLIAKENETVEIRDGSIYVNGTRVEPPADYTAVYYYNRGEYGQEGKPVTVPGGSYYVLGDNSASSRDSRFWGFVPKENVIGKAMCIYWPIHRIRAIR